MQLWPKNIHKNIHVSNVMKEKTSDLTDLMEHDEISAVGAITEKYPP